LIARLSFQSARSLQVAQFPVGVNMISEPKQLITQPKRDGRSGSAVVLRM
jgi:hypothetical protein